MHPPAPDHDKSGIALLLALVCLALSGAEAIARFVVPRISKIESRVIHEKALAKRMGATPDAAPEVLVVGNSLLNESIDPIALGRHLAPHWQLRRLVVESTNYNDWYFALRKLLADGSRPTAIVMMLNASQLASDQVRGTYSAYHLFSLADSVAAGHRAGLHMTEITGLAVGHLSAYYGLREELRKFALQRVVPGATNLAALLVPPSAAQSIPPTDLERIANRRFEELSTLCRHHHIQCSFMLAPRLGAWGEGDLRVMAAGESSGLRTRTLQGEWTWTAADFDTDRFHMNAQGASHFTAAFGPVLLEALGYAKTLPDRRTDRAMPITY